MSEDSSGEGMRWQEVLAVRYLQGLTPTQEEFEDYLYSAGATVHDAIDCQVCYSQKTVKCKHILETIFKNCILNFVQILFCCFDICMQCVGS